MKKFSSISNYSVPNEPKVQINKEENKLEVLKSKLLSLMDDLLKIQGSGAARTELVNSAITISGKESLVDSIIDLITNEYSTEKVKLLESLKLEMNDWYFLDGKIEQINNQIIEEKNTKNSNIERRLVTFLELYGDETDFELHTEMLVNRFNKNSDINDRVLVAESLLKRKKLNRKQTEQIKLLVEKLKQRLNK
jgi:hypothetical protein